MPERPDPKVRPHPAKRDGADEKAPVSMRGRSSVEYAELAVTSNFTFLRGASHPEEFVEQAAALGYTGAAIADTNTLAGIVRAHVAAKEIGIPLAVGSRIVLNDPKGVGMLLFASSRASYARLCSLLTLGKRRAAKGECRLSLHDLLDHQEGLLCVWLAPETIDERAIEVCEGLARTFDGDRFSVGVAPVYTGEDEILFAQVDALCARIGAPMAAINDVRHHCAERKALQDVLTCIREGCTLETAGHRLAPNAERHLKSPEEMSRLFAAYPHAIVRSAAVCARAVAFSLDELRYEYPEEVCPPGLTPDEHLRNLTYAGAAARYPQGIPSKVRDRIDHELTLIGELEYAKYFLTVYEIVHFARQREIVCQGRGAAANSAVCYCLGVTSVDPDRIDLLFERFVSKERDEPPDIDIDFEHERREEVIQHIYETYGRDRAALTAVIISYRGRSAVREVGKALGLSLDCVDRMAKNLDKWSGGPIQSKRLREAGVNPDDPTILRLIELVNQVRGFPRHLGQHVGGFVITKGPLSEMVPVENAAMDGRTVIEWDKDDVDAMGMLKVDVLGLGMLTCVRKAFDFLELHEGERYTLATVPPEDPEVYDMICEADTVGVFQIESRAQMQMLPRLRPRCYYDLVIEVAIVRPGPIHGDMVHPYLRRRRGEETIEHPSEEAKRILGKTLGVPLFQEQAMALAIGCAGFTPGEADRLRRAMAAWKRNGNKILGFRDKLVNGMLAHGYEQSFAERCFEQLKGFSEYGFPESHAASFALIVYVSCWLKKHKPAVFAAALINSQPMGFYAPAQIVRDAREHDVDVRPVDVNHSRWDCTLEDGGRALRLGMRLVKGLREEEAEGLSHAALCAGGFASIEALWKASGVSVATLRSLAQADAFSSMGLDRQQALWAIRPLRDERMPIFEGLAVSKAREVEPKVALPAISPMRRVISDYESTGLSLKAHPVSFARERLAAMGAIKSEELRNARAHPQEARVRVAGLVLVRQRPGTASGVVFLTLEDETGVANIIIHPSVYERCRAAARHGLLLLVHGNIQREREVVHVLAREIRDVGDALQGLTSRSRDFH